MGGGKFTSLKCPGLQSRAALSRSPTTVMPAPQVWDSHEAGLLRPEFGFVFYSEEGNYAACR
jgi:hypothetical protein